MLIQGHHINFINLAMETFIKCIQIFSAVKSLIIFSWSYFSGIIFWSPSYVHLSKDGISEDLTLCFQNPFHRWHIMSIGLAYNDYRYITRYSRPVTLDKLSRADNRWARMELFVLIAFVIPQCWVLLAK